MATKSQIETWAKAAGVATEGMTQRQIESAMDAASTPRTAYTFKEVVQNNFRAVREALKS
jgi:hypothetical protein